MEDPREPIERFKPGAKDVQLIEAVNFILEEQSSLINESMSGMRHMWDNSDVLARLQKDRGTEEFNIVANAKVVKGDQDVVAFSFGNGQTKALEVLFSWRHFSISESWLVEVESQGKKEIARLKVGFHRTKSVNQLLVSSGLAKKLGVKNGSEIRILDAFQDVDEINLDNY